MVARTAGPKWSGPRDLSGPVRATMAIFEIVFYFHGTHYLFSNTLSLQTGGLLSSAIKSASTRQPSSVKFSFWRYPVAVKLYSGTFQIKVVYIFMVHTKDYLRSEMSTIATSPD